MLNQNSSDIVMVRPDDLMAELDLKKSTYYDDLKFLKIKASKDTDGKAYLTNEDVEKITTLRSYVKRNGKRQGFEYSALAVSSNSNNGGLAQQEEEQHSGEEIFVEIEEPTQNLDVNDLLRSAANLKARELATPSLVIRELANQMTENDLPEDLQEKVAIAKEAVNPKWTPADIAGTLLSQHRQKQNQLIES